MVNNYAKTTAIIISSFVYFYDYSPSNGPAADETYIKIRGVKSYAWLIMDKLSRSILGYQVGCPAVSNRKELGRIHHSGHWTHQ